MKLSQPLVGMILIGLLLVATIAVVSIQIKKSSEIVEADLIKPNAMTIDKSLDKTTANKMIRAAQLFYTFWNTGQYKYLDAATAPTFIVQAMPKSNSQNAQDLKTYSNNLRSAMPDFHCTIEDLLVTGDKITARLFYSGTSKHNFMGYPPTGKPVKFTATDILRVQNGKVVEDWHVEDSLSLLEQLNIVSIKI